jgi:hypothetical protein
LAGKGVNRAEIYGFSQQTPEVWNIDLPAYIRTLEASTCILFGDTDDFYSSTGNM